MSNREFLEKYAKPGCIGLSGGDKLACRVIRCAERHISGGRWSNWSHAFLFGERRMDGNLWVIESDLQAAKKHIRFGVQENRMDKYFDEETYAVLAVLDFNLPPDRVTELIREGLHLVAGATQYSIRELFGTLVALRQQQLRERENKLAREKAMYCSAMVQHLFGKVGVELCPAVNVKHSTPEDIFQSLVPHTRYVLNREIGESKVKEKIRQMRQRLKSKRND